ncbi:MAG: phage tail fiber protein [Alphaproteobacteria bacterium]
MAKTRAPTTIITVTLTGQSEFDIPFEYLARKFVELTLIGTVRQPLVMNTDYRFVTKTKVSLTVLPGGDFTHLELRRVTSATERLVDFHDGSILRAYDLNLAQYQTLHVAEEARDLIATTLGINDSGQLDARNRQIVNLEAGVAETSAANVAQVRSISSGIVAPALEVATRSADTASKAAADAVAVYNAFTELAKNQKVAETVPLGAGQVVVAFSRVFVNAASIFVNGPRVDHGHLTEGIDYSVTGIGVITLFRSYPTGTSITAEQYIVRN